MPAETCYRHLFTGLDAPTPRLDGSKHAYINLDNAASTPALKAVERAVVDFLAYYSSVHRGTGFKSQLSTHAYEDARERVMAFMGADPAWHTCIFGKNTTEMINRLAKRVLLTGGRDVVVVSTMEHHSNDLPWRGVGQVLHIAVTPEGKLDLADYERILREYGPRIALVAVTGASNVTGVINPVHRMAEQAHAVGAQMAVDCAQLAPHRRVDMGDPADPGHLDYTVISGHKLYAPFGTGALIGRRDTFERGEPDHRGGGQVEFVTLDEVAWSGAPERDEAGSPNTIGAVALAAAVTQLEAVGMDNVAGHEADLTEYALNALREVPGLRLFGDTDPERAAERLGVLPMQLDGVPHFLAAAVLGHEFGIGVRSGCFCAHPYLMKLLEYSEVQAARLRTSILSNDRREMPGMVRASFGLYNTCDDVDRLVEALQHIRRGEYAGVYHQDPRSGEYAPEGWKVDFEEYFTVKSEL
jgi:selenocysteine lyase/cysteine desulfurase